MVHKSKIPANASDLEKAVLEAYNDMLELTIDPNSAKDAVKEAVDGILDEET